MKNIISEYKEFALKGSVLDMAIGIVIGTAFATIASSFVANIMAPVIGLLTSGVDMADLFLVLKEGEVGGTYTTLDQANRDGAVTLSYGLFINSIISFFIVSWVIFFVLKTANRISRSQDEYEFKKTKQCPMCYSEINKNATVCSECTSTLT
jgi:large conductance mechanosensitive channel